MKFVYVALLLTVFGAAALSGAEPRTLLDANRDEIRAGFFMKNKGQASEPGEVNGRKLLWIEYNCAEAPYCAATLGCPSRSLALKPFKVAEFEMDLYLPEEANASQISMLLSDCDGELFQQFCPIKPDARGWATCRIVYDTGKEISCYGGKVPNRKIDFPVRVYGMNIDFRQKIGTGRLGFGSLRVTEKE